MLRIKNSLQGLGIDVEEVKHGQDGNLYFYGTLDFEKLSGDIKNTFYKGLNKYEKTFFESMTKYCYVDFRDHYGGLKPEIRIIKNLSGAKYLKVLKGVRKKYVDLCMIVEKNIGEWYDEVREEYIKELGTNIFSKAAKCTRIIETSSCWQQLL